MIFPDVTPVSQNPLNRPKVKVKSASTGRINGRTVKLDAPSKEQGNGFWTRIKKRASVSLSNSVSKMVDVACDMDSGRIAEKNEQCTKTLRRLLLGNSESEKNTELEDILQFFQPILQSYIKIELTSNLISDEALSTYLKANLLHAVSNLALDVEKKVGQVPSPQFFLHMVEFLLSEVIDVEMELSQIDLDKLKSPEEKKVDSLEALKEFSLKLSTLFLPEGPILPLSISNLIKGWYDDSVQKTIPEKIYAQYQRLSNPLKIHQDEEILKGSSYGDQVGFTSEEVANLLLPHLSEVKTLLFNLYPSLKNNSSIDTLFDEFNKPETAYPGFEKFKLILVKRIIPEIKHLFAHNTAKGPVAVEKGALLEEPHILQALLSRLFNSTFNPETNLEFPEITYLKAMIKNGCSSLSEEEIQEIMDPVTKKLLEEMGINLPIPREKINLLLFQTYVPFQSLCNTKEESIKRIINQEPTLEKDPSKHPLLVYCEKQASKYAEILGLYPMDDLLLVPENRGDLMKSLQAMGITLSKKSEDFLVEGLIKFAYTPEFKARAETLIELFLLELASKYSQKRKLGSHFITNLLKDALTKVTILHKGFPQRMNELRNAKESVKQVKIKETFKPVIQEILEDADVLKYCPLYMKPLLLKFLDERLPFFLYDLYEETLAPLDLAKSELYKKTKSHRLSDLIDEISPMILDKLLGKLKTTPIKDKVAKLASGIFNPENKDSKAYFKQDLDWEAYDRVFKGLPAYTDKKKTEESESPKISRSPEPEAEWLGEGVDAFFKTSQSDPVKDFAKGQTANILKFITDRLLKGAPHLDGRDPLFLFKGVNFLLNQSVRKDHLGKLIQTRKGKNMFPHHLSFKERREQFFKQATTETLLYLFPQGWNDLPGPMPVQQEVWNQLQSKLPLALEEAFDPLFDPLKRTKMVLKSLRAINSSSQKSDPTTIAATKEELEKELKKMMDRNLKESISSVSKTILRRLDQIFSKLFGIFGQRGLKFKKVLDKIFRFIFVTMLGPVFKLILYPVTHLSLYIFHKKTGKPIHELVEVLSMQECELVVQEAVLDSLKMLEKNYSFNHSSTKELQTNFITSFQKIFHEGANGFTSGISRFLLNKFSGKIASSVGEKVRLSTMNKKPLEEGLKVLKKGLI